ncbi:MAG TPA: hypothetical protein VFN67_18555 [Polyangiales bacterium]|nr:hypothetical protein [Polyangiales bacterium]
MTFGRSLIIASMLCAPIAGCSDGDTILALNVTLKPTASSARTLAVSITQPGQSALDTTVTIATKETDAGIVLKSDKFFERITLPASYTEAEASVRVVAKDMGGAEVGSATAMVGVLPAEAVAGFVTIGEDPPPAAAK